MTKISLKQKRSNKTVIQVKLHLCVILIIAIFLEAVSFLYKDEHLIYYITYCERKTPEKLSKAN